MRESSPKELALEDGAWFALFGAYNSAWCYYYGSKVIMALIHRGSDLLSTSNELSRCTSIQEYKRQRGIL